MPQRYYSNVSKTMELQVPLNNFATSVIVDDASGLPALYPFNVIVDYGNANVEIVSVTNVASNVLTVVRGQEDTVASSHSAGAVIVHGATALDFTEAASHVAQSSEVHGIGMAAEVVGTITAQTLTNKTMSGALNTFSAIPSTAVTGPFSNLVTNQTSPGQPSLKVNTVTGGANQAEIGTTIAVNLNGQLQTNSGATGTWSQRWYGSSFSSQVAEMSSAGLLTCVGVTSTGLISANAGLTVPSGQTATLSGTLTVSGTFTVSSGTAVTFNSAATFGNNQTTTFSAGTTLTAAGTVNLNGTIAFGGASTVSFGNGFAVPTGKTAAIASGGTLDVTSGSTANLNGTLTRDSSAAKPLMYSSIVTIPAVGASTSASFVDMSGITDTFTVPAGRTATVYVSINVGGLCNTAGNTQEFLPVIDGAGYAGASNGFVLPFPSAANMASSFSFTATLAAGSHTIKLQEKRQGGSASITYRTPYSNMSIMVYW